MKIAVYRAVSHNGVLTEMATSLTKALSAVGAEADLLPIGGPDWVQSLVGALGAGRYDYALSFGSFTAELVSGDGRSAYDLLGCGFVGWDVDHPAYQYRRFATSIRDRLQVCASQSHFDFEQAMGCRTAACLMTPGVDAVAEDAAPLDDRPIPVAVAMSWLGEPEMWWDAYKGTPVHRLIQGVVDRMMADPEADILRAYRGAARSVGLDAPLGEDICNILARVGLYLRQHDRLRVAEALAASDIPCVVYGKGWRERLGERPHMRYADDTAFGDVGGLYRDARIVLNLNAANGASERAILAMASGAVAVSDASPLLRSEFEGRGGLRFFDRSRPNSLKETLSSILSSGDAQAVADRGRALVAEAHLWTHKAARLLGALQSPALAERRAAIR